MKDVIYLQELLKNELKDKLKRWEKIVRDYEKLQEELEKLYA